MTLSFAEASRVLAQVANQTADFQQACAEQIREKQDELDGVDSALRAVLAQQSHIKLPDGTYLYLKETPSTRALNETRIARAIDALTLDQCAGLSKSNPEWTPLQVLTEAMADNLDEQCIVHSEAPAISKKCPVETTWRPAPASVVQQVVRYKSLQEQLSMMRKHRSVGKKRAAAVQAVAEPVVHAYLEENSVAKQIVQFGPAPASPVQLPQLPPLPVLSSPVALPDPITSSVEIPQAPPGLEDGQKIMFTTRTYTSRGKAPKLNTFIDAIPQSLQRIASSGWKQAVQNKGELLKALITLFQSQFQSGQGSVKKRLIIKNI